jgi:ABC-type lipoprotein release transport system permease subunit
VSRLRLLVRLAVRDLRRRLTETLLLLAALTVAATTLTVALLLQGQTTAPYSETRARTAGPDVVASLFAPVTAHSAPFPVTWSPLRFGGIGAVAETQGRPLGDPTVDRPEITDGRWLTGSDDDVVLERGFAQAMDAHVGDTLTLRDRHVHVAGIAVSAALPPYSRLCMLGCALGPDGDPNQVGLVWTTDQLTKTLATPDQPVTWFQFLRLDNAASAPEFALRNGVEPSRAAPELDLTPWQEVASRYNQQLADMRTVTVFGSTLLLVLALATLVVLVGARMTDDVHRVGILKAAGATPGFVVRLLLISYLAIALIAACVGAVVGRLLAPRLVTPNAGLIGQLGPTSLTSTDVLAVLGVNLLVVVLATLVPGWRAARTSTVNALSDAGTAPHRSRLLLPLSLNLPPAALLGLRLAARRPRRTLLTALAIAVAVCGGTATLYATADIGDRHARAGGPVDPQVAQLNLVLTAVVMLLTVMSSVTLIFIARATALDARKLLAVVRALGTTPGQAASALGLAPLIPAAAGLPIGMACGVLVIHVLSGDDVVRPPAWQLVGLALLTVLLVVALTGIPAHIEARRPVVATLRDN